MADVKQIPAEVNIEVKAGDDWSRLVDFNINLTGYTFTARTSDGNIITVTDTDLTNGQITLSMSDAVTLALKNFTTWYLAWTIGGNTRTVFEGKVTVV